MFFISVTFGSHDRISSLTASYICNPSINTRSNDLSFIFFDYNKKDTLINYFLVSINTLHNKLLKILNQDKKMKSLSNKQKFQEERYIYPYHYITIASAEFKLIWGIESDLRHEYLKNKIIAIKPKTILDVGCGDARLFYELKGWSKRNKVKLIGVDYSKNAIRFAKAFNPSATFYARDATDLNLTRKSDLILFIETLEHIKPKEINKVLKGISKQMHRNSKLIISVPTKNVPLQKKHYQHFTPESLKKTLSSNFKVNNMEGLNESGVKYSLFKLFKHLGSLVYPLRNRLKLMWYYKALKTYYKNYILNSDINKARKLVAICSLKDKR